MGAMTRLLVSAAVVAFFVGCGREADPGATTIPPVTPTPTPSPAGPFELADVKRDGRRAWSVPALKARVLLSRRGTQWCLSAPEIEPGIACAPNLRYGVAIDFSHAYVAVAAPDAAKPPLLTLSDGKQQTLQPGPGGLIVLVNPPHGSSLTLYDKDGLAFVDNTTQGG